MLLIFKRKFQGIANGKSHLSKIKSNSVDVNVVPPLLACEALNLLGSRVTGQLPLPSFTTCCIHSSPPELALILTRGFHWQMLHRSGLSNMLWSPLKLRLNFPLWLLIACMQGFWYWHKVPSHSYSDPLNDNFFLPSKPAPCEQPLLIAKVCWKLEVVPLAALCGDPEELQCSHHHSERKRFHLNGAGLLISQLLLLPQFHKNIHFSSQHILWTTPHSIPKRVFDAFWNITSPLSTFLLALLFSKLP